MSTTRQIAHNTMIQIGGKIISTLLGLFAIGMLTRYLGTEKYGWYTTAISFLQFIGILIDFGMTPVTAQMLSEEKTNKDTLLKNLLGFRFVTAVLFLGIAPLFSLFFPYPPEVKQAILLMTLSFLAIAMNQIFMGFYQTKLAMHIQAVGESTGRIILIIGLWALISHHAGFLPLMGIVTASSLAYTAVLWIWARKFTSPTFAYDWTIWKKIMIKMWPIAISILFNVIYMRGDIIILSTLFLQTEVGLYGAAYRVIDILAQVAMMLMGVMLPVLSALWAEKATAKFAVQYQQAFNAMALIGFPMATGAIMLSTKIMVLVAGKDFAPAGVPLRILALAVAAVFVSATFGHTAVAINRQKETMWVYITSAILTLGGYFYFIPRYGMLGASWMTVFSETFVAVFLGLTIHRYIGIKLEFSVLTKILFSCILMAAALLLFSVLPVIMLIMIGGLVYAGSLYILGGISKETLREIFKRS